MHLRRGLAHDVVEQRHRIVRIDQVRERALQRRVGTLEAAGALPRHALAFLDHCRFACLVAQVR
jgi:hypothetical protein